MLMLLLLDRCTVFVTDEAHLKVVTTIQPVTLFYF